MHIITHLIVNFLTWKSSKEIKKLIVIVIVILNLIQPYNN